MSSPPSSQPVPRVWVLTNAPSPYQVELFSAIAAAQKVQLEVRFLRDSSSRGPERRFSHRICKSWLTLSSGDELRIHGRAIWEATFGSYDLYILSGLYTSVTFLTCAWILHCRGKKWALWWERPRAAKPESRRFPWTMIHAWKDAIRRWLLHSADLVIGIGSAAVKEYQEMGVRPDRLRMLPYCCDVTRFSRVSPETREQMRRELGWSDKIVFLFSGQMIPRKGVDVLLAAFNRLAQDREDVALLLLGEGTDRATLQASVPDSLRSRVVFRGLVPQDQLPEQFAIADVFAFSSRHDGWAVVLNEACGASLPIIATYQTGAAHDLVRPGENGLLVNADDVDRMHNAMQWCASHQSQLPHMGELSHEIVQPLSAVQGAQTFIDHVHYCLSY